MLYFMTYFSSITIIIACSLSLSLSCDPQARRFYGSKYQTTTRYVLHWTVWCGVVWCGVVWCGVVWCGVVWCGVVWCANRGQTVFINVHSTSHRSCMYIHHNYCTYLSICLSLHTFNMQSHHITINIPVDIILIKLII
jgi:hypothetical protein